MATASEGGIGGKFRKRPLRRPSTPYDRPPTALTNPNGNGGSGWLSKIVSGSAARLFSSVFRKRLPAPPEENLEPRNELPEEVFVNLSSEAKEEGNGKGENQSNSHFKKENQSNSFESSGINELEQLLKQQTFTRVEFDHLTELLRARTVDLPTDGGNKITEPSTSQPVATQARDEKKTISARENIESSRLFESISTPTGGLLVPEEEPASPAELAKAYMGTRPSKVSPSTLGFRSQMLREDPSLLNVPFAPKSPNMLLAPRSTGRFPGVRSLSENRHLTSRPLERSAIYSMVRSPYTRVHSKATIKAAETSNDGYAGSLASQWTRVGNTPGGKQALKRTSLVLDNDFGSVGPIRRIRQKSNLTSPSIDFNSLVPRSPLSIPQTPVGSDTVQGSILSMQNLLLLDGPKNSISKLRAAEIEDNKLSTASSAFVPTQSSEMARKILQQLEKLVPSPNEKPLGSKVALAGEKSPMTRNISNGQCSKSTENIQSSKLQNVQVSCTLDDLSVTQLTASGNSIFGKQERIEVNGPTKPIDTRLRSSEADDVKTVVNSVKDTLSDVSPVGSELFGFAANQQQNKQAFQMSSPEDGLELDNNSCRGKHASTPCAVEKGQRESYISEQKTAVTETVEVARPLASSESKPAAVLFTSTKGADAASRSSDGSIVAAKDAGFVSTVTLASDTLKPPPPVPAAHSSSLFNKSVSPKEQPTTPLLSFGSKSISMGSVFTFSSTTNSISGTSGINFIDSKSEMLNSNATTDSTPPEATGSDKYKKNLKAGDLNKLSENAITGISTSATPNIFSFGASTNSHLTNGSRTSTSSSFSVFAAPAAPIFETSASIISFNSSAATSGCSSSSSSSISTAAPVFSAASISKFGVSSSAAVTSMNSVLLPTSTSSLGSTDLDFKTKQASLPFSTMGSSIPATTSAFTHTGNSIFSFGASVSSSSNTSSFSASNPSQSSTPFHTAVGSLFGTASGITSFTHGMQSQFGTSASSSTFGLSGSSSFGSASSPFGSSPSSAKLFGSGSGSGLSSSASFPVSISSFSSGASFSFASASNTSTSLFSSNLQPSTSSISGSGFGFTSPATGSSFGAFAGGGGSTPLTFGSSRGVSSGSLFAFTSAATPAAASSSLSTTQPVLGMTNPSVNFSSASPGNDQMNVEDSMAEDTVQESPSVAPAFGQPASSPSPLNFSFGSPAIPPSNLPVFQFGGHQSPVATSQSPSPFPGGSFSLGAGGVDKSNRRIVKIRRDKHRKK